MSDIIVDQSPQIQTHMFSSLSGSDLDDLLHELKKIFIKYRRNLNLDPYVTFGIEIEFEKAILEELERILDEEGCDWDVKFDETVTDAFDGFHHGGEISSSVLIDNEKCWNRLEQVCKILKEHGAKITNNCGGHIHAGAHILKTATALKRFFKLLIVYERVIFRFAYGEYLAPRKLIMTHAYPIGYELQKRLGDFDKFCDNDDFLGLAASVSDLRYYAFRFSNIRSKECMRTNTVEARVFNDTLEPAIWQNNINFFTHLMMYAASDDYNEELIDEKLKYYDYTYFDINYFNELYYSDALELADLIFHDDISKIFFLRQYCKNFEANSNDEFKKIKLSV